MATIVLGTVLEHSTQGHARWVRITHWILAASVLTLAFSGFVILMSHPRLYWGQAGNDLTPALFELPISRNYKHGGWAPTVTFADSPSVVSSARTYDIFNENGWARSLHFLAAWCLVVTGTTYVFVGLSTGHLWRNLVPRLGQILPRQIWRDVLAHVRFPMPRAHGGPPYGSLQKLTYAGVVLIALPLMVLTGLEMAPAVTAAYPSLLDLFGGSQSARTIHFFAFAAVVLFVLVHVAMVALTGFKRQIRAMTIGN